MPLLAGSVSVTGGIGSGTGLAKELYDGLREDQEIAESPLNDAALKVLASFCNTIASKVITHFVSNAVVSTTDTCSVASGIAVQVNTATGTGTTVMPGTATGTGTGTIS